MKRQRATVLWHGTNSHQLNSVTVVAHWPKDLRIVSWTKCLCIVSLATRGLPPSGSSPWIRQKSSKAEVFFSQMMKQVSDAPSAICTDRRERRFENGPLAPTTTWTTVTGSSSCLKASFREHKSQLKQTVSLTQLSNGQDVVFGSSFHQDPEYYWTMFDFSCLDDWPPHNQYVLISPDSSYLWWTVKNRNK